MPVRRTPSHPLPATLPVTTVETLPCQEQRPSHTDPIPLLSRHCSVCTVASGTAGGVLGRVASASCLQGRGRAWRLVEGGLAGGWAWEAESELATGYLVRAGGRGHRVEAAAWAPYASVGNLQNDR